MNTHAHVLIVEDDHALSRLYAKVLQREGMRTLMVETIEDALRHLGEFDPDVVSLDWQLAKGTSAPILEAVRYISVETRPKVVLLSGNIHAPGIDAYNNVIETYLEKPINAHALVETIRSLAQRAAAERQPLQKVTCTNLGAGVVVMRWQGHITAAILRSLMEPDLATAQAVIFDIRRLNIARLDLTHHGEEHPPVPLLRRVWVVHDPDAGTDAHYLMRYLRTDAPILYTTDYEAALNAALHPQM